MKKYPIRFNNLEEVTTFVKTVNRYDCDMDLCRGSIIIDAKSILGIMTIFSEADLELAIHTNDQESILKSLSAFLIDKKTA